MQYVNSMNCIVHVWVGPCGGSALYGWFRTHRMFGLSLALHWHLCVWVLQLHGNSQFGTVFSWVCPSVLPVFTNMKHRDVLLDMIIFCIS